MIKKTILLSKAIARNGALLYIAHQVRIWRQGADLINGRQMVINFESTEQAYKGPQGNVGTILESWKSRGQNLPLRPWIVYTKTKSDYETQ